MFLKILTYIEALLQELEHIPEERRLKLDQLANYITEQINEGKKAQLNFICTHNSRRSHISQIWAATAAAYYDVSDIATFSGGTEATAFNSRAVAAMQRVGFEINGSIGENPHYKVAFGEDRSPMTVYSKTFDALLNPKQDFAAIMTCSEADEACPYIPGASWRLALPYEDPKVADDTADEAARYDERVRQIGREILYIFRCVNKNH